MERAQVEAIVNKYEAKIEQVKSDKGLTMRYNNELYMELLHEGLKATDAWATVKRVNKW